ncbi:MAG: FtsX-like permease family protein [Thermoplasmatota archaeon]
MPTIVKKSYRDLNRRKTRTIFTLLTIALGVAGIGMFAIVPLMDRAMEDEIEKANIYNVQLSVSDVDLTEENIEDIGSIPNVAAFEARTLFFTKIYIGERRNDALLVGIRDFDHQDVDTVIRNDGDFPGTSQVLTESANSRYDLFNGGKGGSIRIVGSNGSEMNVDISGEARSLLYATYPNLGIAIFYTGIETVQSIGNISGYNLLSFRLEDASQEASQRTVEDIRSYLTNNTSVVAFADLPDIREEGSWPGEEMFSSISTMFYFIAIVAIFCSVFLISNTMNTIVSEQKKQIAGMKAIGATRFQVFRSYLTTSFIMGVVGSMAGAFLGVLVAVLFINYIGILVGISPGFMVHFPIAVLSILLGILITIVSSIPALFTSLMVTVREGMEDHGISSEFGSGSIDKALRTNIFLPRTIQMGVRNVGRNKRRSISTMIQILIAVGVLLGVVSFGTSLFQAVAGEYDNWTFDIRVRGQETAGKPFTIDLSSSLENISGVDVAEPYIMSGVEANGDEFVAMGMPHDTLAFNYQGTTVQGDWFTAEQENSREKVMIITEVLSRRMGWEMGDVLVLMTATGSHTFEVVGVSSALMFNGLTCYFPFLSLQDLLHWNDTVSGFQVLTESRSHGDIDRISTEIEDELLESGYSAYLEVWYVSEELNNQANQMIQNALYAIGGLVVTITLIGLMNTLTMNILDRSKEIGMLRCIGASARNIRFVFASEGILLVILGWVFGIPMGYLLGKVIWKGMENSLNIEADFLFPLLNLPIVLVITLAVGLLIIQPPLFRATHIRPGDAIRYQ